jgi:hypothetical protein
MTTRSIGFLGALLPLFAFHLLTLTPATAAPQIVWEVYNRFRFYKEPEIFRDYLAFAQPLQAEHKADWILQTEDTLQAGYSNPEPVTGDGISDTRWYGWASRHIHNASGDIAIRDATCWDRKSFDFLKTGRCEDYIVPASHQVMISVKDTGRDIPADSKCQWTIEPFHNGEFNQVQWKLFDERRAATQSTNDCKQIIEVPYAKDRKTGVNVSVKIIDSAETLPAIPIVVADVLVLGMGDSFGAGVGNPDLPTRIDWSRGLPYRGLKTNIPPGVNLPARKSAIDGENQVSATEGDMAQWLDQRCYRSQYGPQFRTALHLAVSLPHEAVTYIDLACDGARIIEGLLFPKALDAGFLLDAKSLKFSYPPFVGNIPSGFYGYEPQPQLGYASYLLCEPTKLRPIQYQIALAKSTKQCAAASATSGIKICEYNDARYRRTQNLNTWQLKVCAGKDSLLRDVDLLFLSIGGNDIGFAPMVAYAIVDDQALYNKILRWLATDFGALHSADVGIMRMSVLWQKYEVLDDTLCKSLNLCQAHKPVFLTAYPLPADDKTGALCGTGDNAAGATAAFDILRNFYAHYSPNNTQSAAAVKRFKQVLETTCRLNLQRFAKFDGGPNAKDIIAQITAKGELCQDSATWADPGTSGKVLGWQFVGEVQPATKGHGFCAVGPKDVHQGDSQTDALSMPIMRGTAVSWKPWYGYTKPYKSRERWVRTPNDAFAITNWLSYTNDLQDYINVLTGSTTSVMHPTAEGYAGIADALFGRVAKFLCTERKGDFGAEPLCQQPVGR